MAALLLAVAIWPVWGYLARGYLAPGSDPARALVLLGSLGWAGWLWLAGGRAGPGSAARWLPALVLGYALLYPAMPPLARVTLGLGLFGLAVASLPGAGLRERSGIAVLIALAAPSADTLAFFLGGPLRAATASFSAAWLGAAGLPAHAEGTALRVGSALFTVDSPCSGVNGLWSALVVAAALAAHRRLGPVQTGLLALASVGWCIPANAWRSAALLYLTRVRPGVLDAGDAAHGGVGLAVFAVTAGLLACLAHALRSRVDCRDVCSPAGPARAPRTCAVAAAALLAGLIPLAPAPAERRAAPGTLPDWPREWLGQPLRPLASSTELDRRWARLSSGPLARFAIADGGELLLRWVEQPDRSVHPAEDCYRGQGYRVTPLPPAKAPGPPGENLGRAGPVTLWGRFRARREGEDLEVRELIVSTRGPTYSDPAWWWWKVSGPGASDRGPWWVATVQRVVE